MLSVRRSVLVLGTSAGVYLYMRDSNGVQGLVRFSRACTHGARAALDYKLLSRSFKEGTPEHKQARSEVHKQSAARLLSVCQAHGGIYVKFGQYLASMNHILPEEYTSTLKVLQDSNPFVDMNTIKRTFLEEFKKEPSELYAQFDEKPIAAASLAQVHRARTHSGEDVAVKVQYPHLQREVCSDILSMRFLARIVGYLFPDYQYSWLLPDFEESILQELDFVQEAVNSERFLRMFAHRPEVYAPRVLWELTSMRVLTATFVEGCKINDAAAMAAMGIDAHKVAQTVSSIFAEMIYVHGFVHCDPHPGNLLVRPMPGSKSSRNTPFQVVVLDHGMYRRFSSSFRNGYAQLWKAFVIGDDALGRAAATKLGLDQQHFDDLSIIFTYRPPSTDKRVDLTQPFTKTDRDKIRQKYKDKKMKDVNVFLEMLPRDMLFVFRCSNLVRGINLDLGGTTADRMRIMGQCAIEGLQLSERLSKLDLEFLEMLQADISPEEGHIQRDVPPLPLHRSVHEGETGLPAHVLSVIALRKYLSYSSKSRWAHVAYPFAIINQAVDSELLSIDMQERPHNYTNAQSHMWLLQLRLWLLSWTVWILDFRKPSAPNAPQADTLRIG